MFYLFSFFLSNQQCHSRLRCLTWTAVQLGAADLGDLQALTATSSENLCSLLF